jgi:hypothetical protein
MFSFFISLFLTVSACAILTRLGVLQNYGALLITYTFTGQNLPLAIAAYLTVNIANCLNELDGISPAVSNLAVLPIKPVRAKRPAPPFNLTALVIGQRLGCFALGAVFIAHFIPAIPLQVPYWFAALAFGWLILLRCTVEEQKQINLTLIGITVVTCIVLVNVVKAPAIALLTTVAISNLLRNKFMPSSEDCSDVSEDWNPVISFLEQLWIAFTVWCVPGFTISASARTWSSNPNHTLALGGADIIIEGWVVGAWFWHGSLSGKTMLGDALQLWLPDNPISPFGIVFIAVSASLLAALVTLGISRLPLPSISTLKNYEYLLLAPLAFQLVLVQAAAPFGIVICLVAAVLLAVSAPIAGMRALAVCFITT